MTPKSITVTVELQDGTIWAGTVASFEQVVVPTQDQLDAEAKQKADAEAAAAAAELTAADAEKTAADAEAAKVAADAAAADAGGSTGTVA